MLTEDDKDLFDTVFKIVSQYWKVQPSEGFPVQSFRQLSLGEEGRRIWVLMTVDLDVDHIVVFYELDRNNGKGYPGDLSELYIATCTAIWHVRSTVGGRTLTFRTGAGGRTLTFRTGADDRIKRAMQWIEWRITTASEPEFHDIQCIYEI